VAQEEVPARRRDMKRAYLILVDFVLPMPMTALMYYIWRQRTGSALFSVYVLTLACCSGTSFQGSEPTFCISGSSTGRFV